MAWTEHAKVVELRRRNAFVDVVVDALVAHGQDPIDWAL